jgi:hypothetical protein
VLEGPQRRVFARMEEVITDRRHNSLRILREHAVEARRFENWSFGSLPRCQTDPEEFIWNLTRRLR